MEEERIRSLHGGEEEEGRGVGEERERGGGVGRRGHFEDGCLSST